MTVGNVAALTQTQPEAHAGLLVDRARRLRADRRASPGTPRGVTAMLIYLLIYSFMQLGAFAVIVMMRRQDVVGDELKDFSGLLRPPSVGGVRDAAVHAVARRHPADRRLHGQVLAVRRGDRRAATCWLAVIGVLNSAISLYYYIRIVVFMYLKKETMGSEPTSNPAMTAVLVVTVGGDSGAWRLPPAALRGGGGVRKTARSSLDLRRRSASQLLSVPGTEVGPRGARHP